MEPTPHDEPSDFEIHRTAIGDRGRTATIEFAGFALYLLSLAGFVVWLLIFGVNV